MGKRKKNAGTDDQQVERSGSAAEEDSSPGGLLELGKSFLWAALLFVILRAFVLQTFVIISGSMEDTLQVRDFLVVNRLSIGSRVPFTQIRLPGYSELRRGDVVVFDPHHEDDLKLVKRLVGLPGDTLEMVEGQLFLNGTPQVEPYVKHVDPPEADDYRPAMEWQRDHLTSAVGRRAYSPTRDNWGPLVVPSGHLFLLGDNRDSSRDSRYWGPLASWRLEGRVALRYFAYDNSVPFGFLRRIRWDRLFTRVD